MLEQPEQERPKRKLHPLEALKQEQPVVEESETEEIEQPKTKRVAIDLPTATKPYVTYILVGINVAIFLAGYLNGQLENELFIRGANSAPAIVEDGEYYRLFTAMFLHANVAHIFFNMYMLYVVGMTVERLFGPIRFLIIYLLGGLAGSILSILLGTYGVPSIGASGAVFAIWSAEAVHFYQHRHQYGEQIRRRLRMTLIFVVLNLFIGFSVEQIDNWGHIGGMIGGITLTWFIGPVFTFAYNAEKSNESVEIITATDNRPLYTSYWFVGLYTTIMLTLLLFSVFFLGS